MNYRNLFYFCYSHSQNKYVCVFGCTLMHVCIYVFYVYTHILAIRIQSDNQSGLEESY